MFNNIEHDLTPLELPNIIFAEEKRVHPADNPHKVIASHPFLRPLLIKLAKARPQWTIYGIGANTTVEGARLAVSFVIYHGSEQLGSLTKYYNYTGSYDMFCINNKRMESKRHRGHSTTTKDINKAFKIITKEFYGKTTDELVKDAKAAVTETLSRATAAARSRYNMNEYRARDHMMAFALANWEEFTSHAVAAGLDPTVVDTFVDIKQEYYDANLMYEAQGKGDEAQGKGGSTVVLRGSDYVMTCGETTTVMSHDQLTPHMRRCIGLLKLAEVDTYIPNVGAKSKSDIMFIMPEPEGAKPNE